MAKNIFKGIGGNGSDHNDGLLELIKFFALGIAMIYFISIAIMFIKAHLGMR